MSEKPKPNIGLDLQRIHRVITRGLAVSQKNCQAFAASGFPDDTTREGFWKYCQALEANAHGHHVTEDDLFFPFLRERMPGTDFDGLMADHQEMHGFLAEMRAAREAGSLADMQRALSKMADLWHPHIEKEETEFSPEIAAEVMTVPEHIDMAQKAAAHSQEHAQPAPLAVPFLLYNLEADDRAHFLAVMPPEVTQHLVPVVWKDEWAPMKPFLLDWAGRYFGSQSKGQSLPSWRTASIQKTVGRCFPARVFHCANHQTAAGKESRTCPPSSTYRRANGNPMPT